MKTTTARLVLATLERQRNRITTAAPNPGAKYQPRASVRPTAPTPRVHRCGCADCRNNHH